MKTLFALLLTGSTLWAQTPAPAGESETNRDEILRQALRQAVAGKSNASATPPTVQIVTNAPAADASAPPVPVLGTPTLAPPTPALNPNPQPGAPTSVAGTVAGTTGLAVPSNPPGTNAPARKSIAVPSNPVAPPITAPGPAAAIAPATSPAVQPPPSILTAANTNATSEEIVPAGTINFPAVDINEVMKIYAELVNRTVLRPTTLPGVITLKTQTPLTKKEAIQALDAVLALNGVSVIPVGEKFVKAVPTAQANQTGAAFNKQEAKDLPELGSYVTHVVQVKYVKPTELVTILQPFASTIPQGILPIESSGMLVLRDYTENVKRMLELISKVDVAVPSEFISEVIPIKYALASEISAALNSLSAGGGGTTVGSSGAGTGTGARRSTSSFGSQRTGTTGGGYPGSTGFGTPGSYGQQAQGINQVNTPGGATGGAFTDRLRSIIQRASTPGQIQIIGETKIIADERTNSLLIFASRPDMEMIKKIISQLDVVLAQVLIETVIIEVEIGPDTKDFGFSYLQRPQTAGNWNIVGNGGAGHQLGPGDILGGSSTNTAGALAGGFNYFFGYNQDLDITITAIESNSKAKILQRPRIQTSHAVPAQIFVGESRPYPQGSYYGGGSFGGYSTIQQLQIGVTLEVTPLINPDGLVVMDIHQTIENYAGSTLIAGVGQVPITTRKEATAKVAVRDRDTIILGGLIETDKSKSGSGIPWLMDVPLLGFFFRSSSTSETRKELLVLIRPTVLPTPEIAALAARAEKESMPEVRKAEQEILDENNARLRQSNKEFKGQ